MLELISPKQCKVYLCNRNEIKDFIERNHYSHNINGCISDYCFKLIFDNKIIGAAFFGRLAMANQWKPYGKCADDVIELRRMVLIDDTPKNTESYFIGKMLRWLKLNTKIKTVISYSDLEHGHTGIVYSASNFKLHSFKKGAKVIIFNGKTYHDKSIRTFYNGKLKPFSERLKLALESGQAFYKETAGKNCWVYRLKNDN